MGSITTHAGSILTVVALLAVSACSSSEDPAVFTVTSIGSTSATGGGAAQGTVAPPARAAPSHPAPRLAVVALTPAAASLVAPI
jgi:hypothetical protein